MGEGTEQNPYTREDVLKAIEENGDTAKELDLSGKVFEEAIDLSDLDLHGIILRNTHLEKAKLQHTDLEGADLGNAQLEEANLEKTNLKKAYLEIAHLEEAYLGDTHLEGANLSSAYLERAYSLGTHFEGAYLWGAKFSPETRLEQADWGNYILGEEENRWFDGAADAYRQLKMWYTKAGLYDIAGKFFYREMEVKRKALKWWPNPFPRVWSTFLSLICGYGERPLRVTGWAASVILISAVVYFLIGSVWQWAALWQSLYFSAVSFTALGYGSWIDETWVVTANNYIRGLGAAESFIGIFSIALFLITFVRKMTR